MSPTQRKIIGAFFVAAASLKEARLYSQETPTPATESVRVYLTISDKKNLPASLPESSLVALIDEHSTKVISLARAENEKLVFAVLVDTSGSNYDHADIIRQAALGIFHDLSSNNQEGYLITFGVSAFATFKPIGAAQAQKMLAPIKFSGGTALFETVKATCETRLAKATNPSTPRRVILLLSDGDDNYSRATLDQAEKAAQTEGVAIFSLSIQSLDGATANHVLNQLTQSTGGKNIVDKDLVRGAKSLIGAVNAQWVVNLAAPPGTGSQLHPLAIKAIPKNVRVSAPTRLSLP